MSNQGSEEVQWSPTTAGYILKTINSLSLTPWSSVTYEVAVPQDAAERYDEFLAASFVHRGTPLSVTVTKMWSTEDGPGISLTLWNMSSRYLRVPPLPVVALLDHYIHSSGR